MKPQTAAVLALLRTTGRLGITPNMARERVGTDRLAARIAELRADGYNIETTTATFNGKHFARYVLHEARVPRRDVQLLPRCGCTGAEGCHQPSTRRRSMARGSERTPGGPLLPNIAPVFLRWGIDNTATLA